MVAKNGIKMILTTFSIDMCIRFVWSTLAGQDLIGLGSLNQESVPVFLSNFFLDDRPYILEASTHLWYGFIVGHNTDVIIHILFVNVQVAMALHEEEEDSPMEVSAVHPHLPPPNPNPNQVQKTEHQRIAK